MNLVSIIKEIIQRICERINKVRYFFIIADSTQDSSKAEMTVLPSCRIEGLDEGITSASHLHFPVMVECLKGAFTSKETTGKESYQKIMDVLRTNNPDVSKIIG